MSLWKASGSPLWAVGFVVLVLSLDFTSRAADWTTKPPAALSPAAIVVGLASPMPDKSTITIQKGEKIDLFANAYDEDTRTAGTTTTIVPDVPGNVVWKITGGDITLKRTSPRDKTTFHSDTTGTFTITATPDDRWKGTETGIPDPTVPFPPIPPTDTGNRNDDEKKSTASFTLTINVVDAGPTNISVDSTCAVTTKEGFKKHFWSQKAMMGGFRTARMKVSGGTPPNPPNNWNGVFIREKLALAPKRGDATAIDFGVGYPFNDICVATSQGFVVGPGAPYPERFGCAKPAADDCFWDDHSEAVYIPGLDPWVKDGGGVVHCHQMYFFNTTQLKTGSANNRFLITQTYANVDYEGVRRTSITYDIVPD